jgi:hypothetical protein
MDQIQSHTDIFGNDLISLTILAGNRRQVWDFSENCCNNARSPLQTVPNCSKQQQSPVATGTACHDNLILRQGYGSPHYTKTFRAPTALVRDQTSNVQTVTVAMASFIRFHVHAFQYSIQKATASIRSTILHTRVRQYSVCRMSKKSIGLRWQLVDGGFACFAFDKVYQSLQFGSSNIVTSCRLESSQWLFRLVDVNKAAKLMIVRKSSQEKPSMALNNLQCTPQADLPNSSAI